MTRKSVLVLNTGSGSVSFIDPTALTVDGSVMVGEDPRDLVEVRALGTVFVSVAGDGSVAVLNVEQRRVVARAKVGTGPGHIYLHPSGAEIWVANDGSGDLTVLDAVAGDPLATIRVGAGHHKIAFASDGRWAFATNIVDATVTAVDAARHEAVATIPVVRAPHGIAGTPDDCHILVCNNGSDVISVIRVEDRAVVKEIQGPGRPNYVRMSPDGRSAWIAHKSGAVSRFDPVRLEFDGSVAVGQVPERIVFADDGRRVLVNDVESPTVSVLDADRLALLAEIPVERSGWHQGMAFGPNCTTLFAVNHGAGTVSAVDISRHEVVKRLVVGDGPSSIIAVG